MWHRTKGGLVLGDFCEIKGNYSRGFSASGYGARLLCRPWKQTGAKEAAKSCGASSFWIVLAENVDGTVISQ